MWPRPVSRRARATRLRGRKAALDEVVPRQMGISTGRITEPGEVADLAVFLASPCSGNVTGTEFVIDGGQVKTT